MSLKSCLAQLHLPLFVLKVILGLNKKINYRINKDKCNRFFFFHFKIEMGLMSWVIKKGVPIFQL